MATLAKSPRSGWLFWPNVDNQPFSILRVVFFFFFFIALVARGHVSLMDFASFIIFIVSRKGNLWQKKKKSRPFFFWGLEPTRSSVQNKLTRSSFYSNTPREQYWLKTRAKVSGISSLRWILGDEKCSAKGWKSATVGSRPIVYSDVIASASERASLFQKWYSSQAAFTFQLFRHSCVGGGWKKKIPNSNRTRGAAEAHSYRKILNSLGLKRWLKFSKYLSWALCKMT